MTGLLKRSKQFMIGTGLYAPARRLQRRLSGQKSREYRDQVLFFEQLLPPGALCFDVGANIGSKSEAMLAAGAHVVAFEPNPLLLPELRARMVGQQNWTVMPAAVGSTHDILKFYARTINGQSSLDPQGAQEWLPPLAGTFSVPVVTLDSAIRAFGTPFYCKIDVEGWELEVLTGLNTGIPLMSFEFHLNEGNIHKTIQCLQRLNSFGNAVVNVVPGEQSSLLFERWIDIGEFIARFPGDLATSVSELYGDIYVRRNEHNQNQLRKMERDLSAATPELHR